MDSAILNLSNLGCAAKVQLHFPDHFVSNEPSPGGAESCANSFHPKTFRQIMKGQRGIGKKARAHTGTKAGLRMPNLLPARAWLARRLAMGFQLRPAPNQL